MWFVLNALIGFAGSVIGGFCGVAVCTQIYITPQKKAVNTISQTREQSCVFENSFANAVTIQGHFPICENCHDPVGQTDSVEEKKSNEFPEADASKIERISVFASYLENRELSSNTIQAYCTSMRQFFKSYDEVTKQNGIAWKRKLQSKDYSPRTINVRINAFNTYCTMIDKLDCKLKVVRIHHATAVDNVISAEDYKKLLDGLAHDKNWRWYFGIKLLAMTGSRVSEFSRLKKSDLDAGYAEMWTKGKIRRIYIPKSFIDESKDYYKDFQNDEYLFAGRYGKQITRRGVSAMLQKLATKYEIDESVMHPHSFRHLFAMEFLQRDSNLTLLADIMGHSSVSTTAIYTRMSQEQQRAIVSDVVNW